MIPKVIHYCWFGRNPLPELALKCIASWKYYMPDFEVKEWNEDNFDINIIPYTSEAYQEKKYAFVSDYARYWILYNYGGVYFDTDVEMIRPIYDILEKGAFMGQERDSSSIASPGLGMACEKNNLFLKSIMDLYNGFLFKSEDGSLNLKSIDKYMSDFLEGKAKPSDNEIQFAEGFYIYPGEYFGPISSISRKLRKTNNTRTIHLYSATWVDKTPLDKFKRIVQKFLPEKLLLMWNRIKNTNEI